MDLTRKTAAVKLKSFLLSLFFQLLSPPLYFSQDFSTPEFLETFILETNQLEPYNRTYIGNGYFSLVSSPLGTQPTESYMAWVYDHGAEDVPRIAVLPAWNEINIYDGKAWLNDAHLDTHTIRSYTQRLDMYNGILQTFFQWRVGERITNISIESFVSRAEKNLAAIKLQLTPNFSGRLKLSFPIRGWKPPKRLALARIEKLEPWPGHWAVWYPGSLKVQNRGVEKEANTLLVVAQTEGRRTQVAQAASITVPAGLQNSFLSHVVSEDHVSLDLAFDALAEQTYTFHKLVGIVSTGDSPTPEDSALRLVATAGSLGYDANLQAHRNAWRRLWQTDITIEGDPKLQKIIHAMIFYLLCSLREASDFSIPPMGLSSAGYYGHIFWDADTWMLPPLVVMHPEMAKSMVMFRFKTLEAAQRNAKQNGYHGAMYPWESDEIGSETTPKFAYQNALYQNHVTGDVALAQWQYFLATGDQLWLANYGFPVIKETADFWVSRVTYNETKDRYEIRNVVSVDEGLIGIHNDAYTNVVAKKNLEVAAAASKMLGKERNPLWEKIAQKLFVPYDDTNQYHLTYEDAPPGTLGSVVPLLSYPLEYSMTVQAKRNDLDNALKRMAKEGAGGMMGVTLYPLIAAELGDSVLLDELLPKSYQPYLRPPFHVLAETPTNDAMNFITGAGGFLQQVIFGYTGLRLDMDGLVQRYKPLLPKQIDEMTLRNFTVRGKKYDIVIEENNIKVIEK